MHVPSALTTGRKPEPAATAFGTVWAPVALVQTTRGPGSWERGEAVVRPTSYLRQPYRPPSRVRAIDSLAQPPRSDRERTAIPAGIQSATRL